MTVRRAIVASLGLLLAAVLLVVWVVPVVQGPTVECNGIAPAACEDAWQAVAGDWDGIQRVLPVTAAQVSDGGKCPTVYVEWLWGVLAGAVMC
jgi:hypothetical protein